MTAAASPFGRLLLASSLAHGILLAWPGAAPPEAPPAAPAIEVALGVAPTASPPATPARRVAPTAKRLPMAAKPPALSAADALAPTEAPTEAPAETSGDKAPTALASGDSAAPQASAATPSAGATPSPDQLPYARYAPRPPYPETARQQARQGKVRVRVLIAADGTVAALSLATSSGDASLDRAALETLPRWRFSPALRDGEAVSAWVVVPVVFNLR